MRILKILIVVVVSLLAALALFVAAGYTVSNRAMRAVWEIDPVAVQTSSDSATLAHGLHVAEVRGCLDCHGADLSGRVVIDALPVMGRLAGSNLTRGQGGVGASYSDADWVTAIRHGVRPDGTSLVFMPSYEYVVLGPDDLGALISYIKSVPPVDAAKVELVLGPVPRVLYMMGKFPLVSAEMIDHSNLRFEQPAAGVTVEYGGYLAWSCIGCHGRGLSGGKIPGGDPSWPAAANLTSHETGLAGWSLNSFDAFAASGVTPDGREIDAAVMPWPLLGAFTSEEREALWMYLQSLPATEKGNR